MVFSSPSPFPHLPPPSLSLPGTHARWRPLCSSPAADRGRSELEEDRSAEGFGASWVCVAGLLGTTALPRAHVCAQAMLKCWANGWPNVTRRPHLCLLSWVNVTVTLQAAPRGAEHSREEAFIFVPPGPGSYLVSRFAAIKQKKKDQIISSKRDRNGYIYDVYFHIIFLFSGDPLKFRENTFIHFFKYTDNYWLWC